jgi:hypothetical protein
MLKMPGDITLLVRGFGGLPANDYKGLAYQYFKKEKMAQDERAAVRDLKIKSNDKTSVVTPQLSRKVNAFLQYYRDLFDQYAVTKAFTTKITAKTDEEETRANNIVSTLQNEISNEARKGSVLQTIRHFTLPTVSAGEIIIVTPGSAYHLFAGAGGNGLLDFQQMGRVGNALKLYSKYSVMQKAFPDAFPKDEVYGVAAVAQQLNVVIDKGVGSTRWDETQRIINLGDIKHGKNVDLQYAHGPFRMRFKDTRPGKENVR